MTDLTQSSQYLECEVAGLSRQVSTRHPLSRLPHMMNGMSHEQHRVVDGTKQRGHLQNTQRCLLKMPWLWECQQY